MHVYLTLLRNGDVHGAGQKHRRIVCFCVCICVCVVCLCVCVWVCMRGATLFCKLLSSVLCPAQVCVMLVFVALYH